MRDASPFSTREMPDGFHNQGRRDKLLRLPIGEFVAWRLIASCADCRANRLLMVRELVERFEEAATLAVLVPRLRCVPCRRPPSRLVLRNKDAAQTGGEKFVEVMLL